MLEGELEFVVGERTLSASAGSVVYAPRGVLHSFRTVGTGHSRMAVIITPAGLEKFFEEVGKPGTEDPTSPPPFAEEDIGKILAVAPKYGVEIQPPPEP